MVRLLRRGGTCRVAAGDGGGSIDVMSLAFSSGAPDGTEVGYAVRVRKAERGCPSASEPRLNEWAFRAAQLKCTVRAPWGKATCRPPLTGLPTCERRAYRQYRRSGNFPASRCSMMHTREISQRWHPAWCGADRHPPFRGGSASGTYDIIFLHPRGPKGTSTHR